MEDAQYQFDYSNLELKVLVLHDKVGQLEKQVKDLTQQSMSEYMGFGRYSNWRKSTVIKAFPDYAMWAHRNVKWFSLTEDQYTGCYDRINARKESYYRTGFEDDRIERY